MPAEFARYLKHVVRLVVCRFCNSFLCIYYMPCDNWYATLLTRVGILVPCSASSPALLGPERMQSAPAVSRAHAMPGAPSEALQEMASIPPAASHARGRDGRGVNAAPVGDVGPNWQF
jgi:hypothetical protein